MMLEFGPAGVLESLNIPGGRSQVVSLLLYFCILISNPYDDAYAGVGYHRLPDVSSLLIPWDSGLFLDFCHDSASQSFALSSYHDVFW